ncbi:MAG TPA: WD40 repeat domain-containing protein, partial [Gemmataceae bacterium]|nr:WD40 repeat domain-containing protein [Gemmataceae bacterium]
MANAARASKGGRTPLETIRILAIGIVSLAFSGAFSASDEPKPLSADQVKELQSSYQAERAAAEKSGLSRKFAPNLLLQADELAKKGEAALAAGRLLEASASFRGARWLLPALPGDFPEHVRRVFGGLRLRHSDFIHALAFSADGSRLATAGHDGTVKIWDTATGRELRSFAHAEAARGLAFRPDGKAIASAGGKDIKIWDLTTGKEIRTLEGHKDAVTSLAFSPDGKQLASASQDTRVALWNVETGKQTSSLVGHNGFVHAVAYSPNGKLLASVSKDGTSRIWNPANGSLLLQTQVVGGNAMTVAFSPDNKSFAAAGGDRAVRTYGTPVAGGGEEPAAGTVLQTLTGHSQQVTCLAFHHDGKILATGSRDNTVRLWDPTNGQVIRTFRGHTEEVTALAFSPDGTQLVSASQDQTVRFWGLDTVEYNR